MSIDHPLAGGRGAPRWRRPRLRRPTGIRNGGLLLLLVAVAAVMALVDRPPEPGLARRLPGAFQYLPPPVGITRLPPVTAQPLGGAGPPGILPDGDGRLESARAHPRRQHPRPARQAASRQPVGSSAREAGDRPGAGSGRSGSGSPGPVVRPPVPPAQAAPSARVEVPSVAARVTPPSLLGRDLPAVQVETPAVTVVAPAAEVPRLRLG